MINFEEYIRQGEPLQKERGYAWQTAIGLQAVDGLKTSEYLLQTAQRHIEGDITIEEVKQLVDGYYQSKSIRTDDGDRTEEADKVSEKYHRNVGEMSGRGGRIVEMMAKERTITAKQLAKELNITERTIERDIKKLKEAGVVERIGGDRGGFWKIKD